MDQTETIAANVTTIYWLRDGDLWTGRVNGRDYPNAQVWAVPNGYYQHVYLRRNDEVRATQRYKSLGGAKKSAARIMRMWMASEVVMKHTAKRRRDINQKGMNH